MTSTGTSPLGRPRLRTSTRSSPPSSCPEVALFLVPSRDRNGTVMLIYDPMIVTPTLMGLQNELGNTGFGRTVATKLTGC